MQNSPLYNRASKKFHEYMELFLNTGQPVGLPVHRLTPSEWTELNKLLAVRGIALVRQNYNGGEYMFFTKLTKVFQNATNDVRQQIFNLIKSKYPNLPDANIEKIVDMHNKPAIYDVLRHKQGKPYDSPSIDEHRYAIAYANRTRLENNRGSVQMGVPYQHWTYVRKFFGNGGHKASDSAGYHISLNVPVSWQVIDALDNVLARDMGQVINYYKFPTENYYDECVTRFDPITIYTYRRDPVIEKMIVDALAPYARSNEGLLGEMLGRGVCITPEIPGGQISVGQKIAYEISDLIKLNKNSHNV